MSAGKIKIPNGFEAVAVHYGNVIAIRANTYYVFGRNGRRPGWHATMAAARSFINGATMDHNKVAV